MINESRKVLRGIRIGIVGKGGAGKSTFTVLMAQELRTRGYDVCILDADSTNVGLHEALDIERPPNSMVDYFGGMVFSGGRVTCPVDDPAPLPDAELRLTDLDSDFYAINPQGIVLLTAGKIGDLGPGAGCDGPINKIARDLRIETDGSSSVTLVDFKAGFEDSARGAVTGLDWIVVIVDPTKAAIRMAIHMKKMVEQIKAGIPPATEHLENPELVASAKKIFRESKIEDVLVVLNKIKDEEMERYLREELLKADIEPIGALPEDPAITLNWLEGSQLEGLGVHGKMQDIIGKLEKFVREMSPA
jgi:CO dehydrogenase maturation factor